MGKTKSKPTVGKNKGIVSKKSAAKHSIAAHKKKKVPTANKTVVSKRDGAATRTAAQVPHSVTPPPLVIDIRNIFCVGSDKPRRNWNLQSPVQQQLQVLLHKYPTSHFYLFMSTEGLENPDHSVTSVPIMHIIQCGCMPTTFMVKTTVQSVKEEFLPFQSLHMRWKQVHPNVSILQCETPMDGFSREQLILYSELPTQVEAEQPEPVNNITITWNGTEITWMKGDGETTQECVDTEISTASDDDKALVQNLLEQEQEREMANRKKLVEEKKALYSTMIETQDMSVAALQERRVFKIYPQDARLEPTTVTFGNTQFKTGFHKNARVNRYIGNAEHFF